MRIIDYEKSSVSNGYYVLIISDTDETTKPTTCENLGELDNSSARIMPGSVFVTTDLSKRYMMGEDFTWKQIGGSN